MATHEIASVAFKADTTFGALLAATNLPDPGLDASWEGVGVVRSNFFSDGMSSPISDPDLTRDGSYFRAPELETVINNTGAAAYGAADGEAIDRLMGDISLRFRVPQIGAGAPYSTHSDHPFFAMLESSLGSYTPTAASDLVGAGTHSVNEFVVTTAAAFQSGGGVCRIHNNVLEFAEISEVAGTDVTVNPAFSSAPLVGDTIYPCYTLAPLEGHTQSTFSLRFDMSGFRHYGWGCRIASFNFSFENETLFCDITARPAVVLKDHSHSAETTWAPTGAASCRWLQSDKLLSAPIGTGSPPTLARTQLALTSWDATVDVGLSNIPDSRTILGASNMDVGFHNVTLNMTGEPSSDIEDMLRKQEERICLLGCGPAGEGVGMAFVLMAAHTISPALTSEGDGGRQNQSVSFRPGKWELDVGSTFPADTSYRMFFPMPVP